MATYIAQYYTIGVYAAVDGGRFTTSAASTNAGPGAITISDGTQGDHDLAAGDTITITGGPFTADPVIYIGRHLSGEGVILQQNGVQYIFTETTTYAASQNLPARTAPFAACFLRGTRIATPSGEVAVETLAIGDLVLDQDGRARPVRWIGRQEHTRLFSHPLHAYPIQIRAGALDENVPSRDLFLSPGHGLMVEGLLVEAAALVNGSSITRVPRPAERFTYFHIETDDHAVILAEGTPAETLMDNAARSRFDNHAEFVALYGEAEFRVEEIEAPRAKSARQLPASLRRKLDERAAALGLAATRAA
ncbi:Hint domain-containing protein [Roseococcus sp. YIM B11640]|uniref:Hint domain-containing protein n=1 Tax=Roseococcus sp. YIM B11640 TaxID=3133973 RepID=UPI003C7A3EDC